VLRGISLTGNCFPIGNYAVGQWRVTRSVQVSCSPSVFGMWPMTMSDTQNKNLKFNK
jgi:hypothetical protein